MQTMGVSNSPVKGCVWPVVGRSYIFLNKNLYIYGAILYV